MTDETYSGTPKMALQLRLPGAVPMNHGIEISVNEWPPSGLEFELALQKLTEWAHEKLNELRDAND